MSKLPTIVIVGRINVGKSSLFNRLTETTKALVSSIAGTTRDYNIGTVYWRKKTFELIDTGGVNIDILKSSIQGLLNKKSTEPKNIEQEIIAQTKQALKKAKLILMVVDGKAGLLPEDKDLALVVKKLGIPVMLVCNKIDNQRQASNTNEFYKLGLGTPFPVSASNGSRIGDFLDELIKNIKWPAGRPKINITDDSIKVALIGKPNAGKSSLVNQILGEKRVIVSPIPQTTREPQDTIITYKNQKITIIDTAGLKKKAKIDPGLDKASSRKSLEMARTADIVIFVTEADKALTKQDAALAGLIKEAGTALLLVANKWDLVEEKSTASDKKFRQYYQSHFPFLSFVPVLFISAKTGKNVDKILDIIVEIYREKNKQIPEKDLKLLLGKVLQKHQPAQAKGSKRPHIYGLEQTGVNPPVFTIVVKQNDSLHFSYYRFIENQLRENFGFSGVPVTVNTREIKL